jgi:hypothetical protein
VKALRRILGDRVGTPAFARAAGLLIKAAVSGPSAGRPMYAALRAIPVPGDVAARLFQAGSLPREHRGDGHIAALMTEGAGGLEAHVLSALGLGMPAEQSGRIRHLPAAQLAAVTGGMRDRGLIGDDGWLSEPGRAVTQRVEALTDDLAARPCQSLTSSMSSWPPSSRSPRCYSPPRTRTKALAAQSGATAPGQIVVRLADAPGEPASRMTSRATR